MHSRTFDQLALAAAVSVLFAVGLAVPAAAKTPAPAPTAAAPSPGAIAPDSGTLIKGGTAQSTDPTRYDYVPARPDMSVMTASGWAIITPFSYSISGWMIVVPAGYLYHKVTGSGLTITKEEASYWPSPTLSGAWGVNLCNWRIDYQNRIGASSIYSTSYGTTHQSCDTVGIGRVTTGLRQVQQGMECARLYVNGYYRGEQCHSVL